ncbi:oxidoreductase [Nonomuraea sp. NPDC048892]|uniref:oxidoreductase n=1 Tax=Nonomuraea sp. NPDC048892 TaxID=3154624 RepID=UPI0033F8B364
MSTEQHKLGSGFGIHSTTADVLRGIDLSGRLALVTGGYSGLGLETTRALVEAGARVIVPARRPEAAIEALAGLPGVEVGELRDAAGADASGVPGVEVAELDLADLDGVRRFAERFLASGRDLHLLIANAGIMAGPERRVGPGWESQFAVNHLGHFAMVNRLWPALARGRARVVSVSSNGHQLSGIRWDDVQFERGYDKWLAYGQAKTANVLFAVHLDALGKEAGVRAFAVHPGAIAGTSLARDIPPEEFAELKKTIESTPGNPGWKSVQEGAATQVWAATSPRLDGLGGLYCEDGDVADPLPPGATLVAGVAEWAVDPREAARLWRLSADLTGVNAFASPATG